jgi:integrase
LTRFKRLEHPVFATVVGTHHDPKAWHDWEYLHAREKAGLPTIRLHDFRHYAVSKLIAQGANILVVAKIAGHSDPSLTLRVYSHLFADGLADAASRFDPLSRGKSVASERR